MFSRIRLFPQATVISAIAHKLLFIGLSWIMLLSVGDFAWGALTIDAETTEEIELAGYDGLNELLLFKGRISSGTKQTVDTSYHGLALLRFPALQR